MTLSVRFGHLANGQPVDMLRLKATDGLNVEILTYGAIVRSLKIPSLNGAVETVVGFRSLEEYERDHTYQGCVIGRTVNRMRAGQFSRNDLNYQVTRNEGANHLHGGESGLTRRVWNADARATVSDPVVLRYTSPAWEEGYPGTLHATVRFSLSMRNTLKIAYEAEVDQPCPIDLTHHLYFNLGQVFGADIRDHVLTVHGDKIVEVDRAALATGNLLEVDGTLFDLKTARRLGDVLAETHPQLTPIGINQSWVTQADRGEVAALSLPQSRLQMRLRSDQPCLQVWSGLSSAVNPGGAVALEPQGFTDAVNHPAFMTPWLEPGEVYRRTTYYGFEDL